MKFCKRCHKIIIKEISTLKDLANRCRCNDDDSYIDENTEIGGNIKK